MVGVGGIEVIVILVETKYFQFIFLRFKISKKKKKPRKVGIQQQTVYNR